MVLRGVGGGLDQGLGWCDFVMCVCVVSMYSLCRWQVQLSVYCARQHNIDQSLSG